MVIRTMACLKFGVCILQTPCNSRLAQVLSTALLKNGTNPCTVAAYAVKRHDSNLSFYSYHVKTSCENNRHFAGAEGHGLNHAARPQLGNDPPELQFTLSIHLVTYSANVSEQKHFKKHREIACASKHISHDLCKVLGCFTSEANPWLIGSMSVQSSIGRAAATAAVVVFRQKQHGFLTVRPRIMLKLKSPFMPGWLHVQSGDGPQVRQNNDQREEVLKATSAFN